jgi:heme exporter protein D
MDLGPYAGFIIAAYATAFAVVGLLVGWIVADHRSQMRMLGDLEARGIVRRSATREAT